MGRFCHGCGSVYPSTRRAHTGNPVYGRDHISSPCSYEGHEFDDDGDWWEPAVEVLTPAPEAAE